MLYKPLLLSILFLILTFGYFLLGPVSYNIDNALEVIIFFIFYLFMAIIGYIVGVFVSLRLKINKTPSLLRVNSWVVIFAALCSNILFNFVITSGLVVPTNISDFFIFLFNGDLISIANAYYENKLNVDRSFIISILFSAIGWGRYLFIPYVIWNWNSFSEFKKSISFLICILPLLSGLSIGLNKPIFDTVLIFFIFSLLASWIKKNDKNIRETRRLRLLLRNSILGLLMAVFVFGFAMDSRGVSFKYIERNSPTGGIEIKKWVDENPISISGIMFGHYVVQGYYGFSLSLKENFETTYGFGHSPFIMRQYTRIADDDELANKTFQQKIDSEWKDGLRWHSAFAYFANDVGFFGVGFVMFAIFFVMAANWVFAYLYRIKELLYFMPVHGVLVIFLPANNQIFGFADSIGMVFCISAVFLFRLLNFGKKSN